MNNQNSQRSSKKVINDKSFYFASCPRGCEQYLVNELRANGIEAKSGRGGASFKARNKNTVEYIFSARIASRVFKEVGYFYIRNEKQIYKRASELPWEDYITPEQTFKINTLLDGESKELFKSSIFLSQTLKDSLVDYMRDKFGKRPSVETNEPTVTFLQRVEKVKEGCKVIIYADMVGESLDKRGYRESGHRAPLRENLAASLIAETKWDCQGPFYDPMAGSGTILIESIIYFLKLSPAFFRLKKNTTPYSFTNHPWFQNSNLVDWYFDKVHEVMKESQEKINSIPSNKFFYNDPDVENFKLARTHLLDCFGRVDFVNFNCEDFTKSSTPEGFERGVVLFNPPYGERIQAIGYEDINDFYYEIGEKLKNNFAGSTAYILTAHGPLRKNIRLKTSKKTEFLNGDIECRLLKYELM